MALWGIGVMLGPILGPMLGGWLTDNYSWRWVFFINVPIRRRSPCSACWPISPDATARAHSRFDFFGFAMLSLAVGALQLMLDRGRSRTGSLRRRARVELIMMRGGILPIS